MKNITIRNKSYYLPIFLPDATRGVTKGLDSTDLVFAGVEGVVVNTLHLKDTPGIKVLKKFGGIKNFMNFSGLVVSDSGGWQVFSLVQKSQAGGRVTDRGVMFNKRDSSSRVFTPEESLDIQLAVDSDIMICLDDFTPPEATKEEAKLSVDRTIKWAQRTKKHYLAYLKKNRIPEKNRPHLYAVVQGGYFKELRKTCTRELLDIGFDGYGYGGYVVDVKGNLDLRLSRYICNLLPGDKPRFALGMGRPKDIVSLSDMGWDIFDCTLPTRDARHRRLYCLDLERAKSPENLKRGRGFSHIYIERKVFEEDQRPLDKDCDCHTCLHYSRSYLRHLFKINDTLAYKLATIHNLRVYTRLIEHLRGLN